MRIPTTAADVQPSAHSSGFRPSTDCPSNAASTCGKHQEEQARQKDVNKKAPSRLNCVRYIDIYRNKTNMAESGKGESWWGGWIQAAKEKSSEAWGFMQRDLAEFTNVVQKDTSAAVALTADSVKGRLKVENSSGSTIKTGFSNFLMGISETLAPKNYGRDEEEVEIPHKVIFDRAKARLNDIQTDPGTYLNEPSGPPEDYLKWKETFLVDEHKGEISDLLVASDEVRSLYTKLVPSAASHGDFWHRYFYKIHQLEQDEARRNALKERAEITSKTFTEEDLGWGDEDDTWEVAEVPTNMPDDTLKERIESESSITSEIDNVVKSTDSESCKTKTESSVDDQTENIPLDDKKVSSSMDKTEKSDKIKESEASTSKPQSNEHKVGLVETELPSEKKTSEEEQGGCDVTVVDSVSYEGDGEEVYYHDDNKEEAKKALHLPLQKDELKKESSGKSSPVQSDNGTSTKDTSSLSDDWEKDFDIEITEQDMNIAAATKDQDNEEELDDDWENWE
ncbi:BSD domain-containing protein 1-like [Ptychodera flava]|uniref:BSD domain-containing protein 1-like n=1 Tax=Ptychodera flava TaxID=63121 RepID=UPI00396A114D